MINKFKKYSLIILTLLLGYIILNGIKIYHYSFEYSEQESEVGIVLGAGTSGNKISPIFEERLNHAIYLYNEMKIKRIILTGGYGEGQKHADSEIAKEYIIKEGVPENIIFIEKESRYTIENLKESKHIMDSLNYNSALIITDPLHMKRSIELAKKLRIKCKPSPTQTTMYKSFGPKTKSLMYETFYYTLGELAGKN